MKTALVTGGTGTISSGMVDTLIEEGFETYALTRGNMPYRERKETKYLYADKEDVISLEKTLGHMRFDVVVECLVYRIDQLKRSLDFFLNRCDQYIFISTTGIYKRKECCRIEEDHFTDLLEWKYSRDKIECEVYLKLYGEKTGINYTIVRPPVVYGDYRIPYPVATRQNPWTFMHRMKEGRPIVSCNINPVRYEILHISDFSRAVAGLIGNPSAYQETFHIADHTQEYDWDETIVEIGKVLSIDFHILHIPICVFKTTFSRSYDELFWNKIDDLLLDDTKIKRATNFQAKVPLGEGIAQIVSHMEDEYNRQHEPFDMAWNRCCDHTVLVAYALDEILNNEQEVAREYIQRLKKEIFFLE